MTVSDYVDGGRLHEVGFALSAMAIAGYVLGPTVVDPYGDGLWYGALMLAAGLLMGYGIARKGEKTGESG